jgi:hypothetical protein
MECLKENIKLSRKRDNIAARKRGSGMMKRRMRRTKIKMKIMYVYI